MTDYATVLYEERGPVAWVTLNRPEAANSFDSTMQNELQQIWLSLRRNDDIRAIVLTGAGERHFCTGIDRGDSVVKRLEGVKSNVGAPASSPYMFNDVGDLICPKRNDLWKPVVAAVNGVACAGAFYLLGESDIIIANESATFFDPHVSYGMVSAFETVHMMQKMPMGEVLRLVLLGSHERMSAKRACEIGFVSEVVPDAQLEEAATWLAERLADAPVLSIQGTIRAAYAAAEFGRQQALELAYAYVGLGTTDENLAFGQDRFTAKGERPKWRLR